MIPELRQNVIAEFGQDPKWTDDDIKESTSILLTDVLNRFYKAYSVNVPKRPLPPLA